MFLKCSLQYENNNKNIFVPVVCLQDIVDVWSSHGDILEDLEYQYIIEPASMVAKEPASDISCQVNKRLFTSTGSYKLTVLSKKVLSHSLDVLKLCIV